MPENNNLDNTVTFTTAEQIKLLIERDKNMNAQRLSRLLNYSKQNLSTKFSRDSLKSSDIDQILDILGYEIRFVKKS